MKKSKSADVLADPEIQRHTERILALHEEERQTRIKLGSIIAAIGAELVAVKEALDRLSDKTAWLRWLKAMDLLAGRLADIRGRKGSLPGDSKQDVLAAIERLRRTVLKWPAWATPAVAKARTAKR